MLKRAKVVMLSTNQKATLGSIFKHVKKQPLFDEEIDKIGSLIININPNVTGTNEYFEHQHLYIIVREPLKNGDWVINNNLDTLYQLKDVIIPLETKNNWYKVAATTDKTLFGREVYSTIEDWENKKGFKQSYPQPSKSFIEKYVQEYNKGDVIEDVMVECEFNDNYGDVEIFLREPEYPLKVNSKDNTITIRAIKNSFTREELKETLVKAIVEIGSSVGLGDNLDTKANDWIKKNL